MQKPSTVIYKEFKEALETLVGDSGLPAFVMVGPVRELLIRLEEIEERQYQRDLKKWDEAVKSGGEQTDKPV